MISYGTEGDLIEYPLPNLGQTKIAADSSKGILEHTVQELSIQDVKIEVLEHQVLSIQIMFYHPNFGNKYEISIMAPVNYVPDINLPLTSYTLLYDDNGGSGCHDKSIHKMEDDYWGALCTPTKAKNHFDGWKDGTNFVTAETKATKNVTVKAEWTPTYILTYDDNGGSGCSTKNIQKIKNQQWGDLCTPTKTGYKFNGWKNDSDTITKDSIATKDIKVTAQWTPYILKIRYNGNGGSWNGSSTYKIDSSGNVLLNSTGKTFEQIIGYGKSSDLYDANNKDAISFSKDWYYPNNGYEWVANNHYFNQSTKYSAESLALDAANCDLKQKDCTAILSVNWKAITISLRFKSSQGNNLKTCSNSYKIDNSGYIINNSGNYVQYNYKQGQYIGENGLPNYDNASAMCVQKDWYTAEPESEWIVNQTAISQKKNYSIDEIFNYSTCNNKHKDCIIDLSVNWRKTKIHNVYSCNGGTIIEGPKVPQEIVGRSGDNCFDKWFWNDHNPVSLSKYGLADHNPDSSHSTGTLLMERSGYKPNSYWHIGSANGPVISELETFSTYQKYVQRIDDIAGYNNYNKLMHKDIEIHYYAGWDRN